MARPAACDCAPARLTRQNASPQLFASGAETPLAFLPDDGYFIPMRLTVATWNINSVRLRADLVAKFIKATRPEIGRAHV